MTEQSGGSETGPAPKRGEAAWKDAKESIAKRNDEARKRGKAERQTKERKAAERRYAVEKRQAAELESKSDFG